MSLSCPGDTDYACPHWDHTVQLFLDCGGGKLAGEELGRWITPFRRYFFLLMGLISNYIFFSLNGHFG